MMVAERASAAAEQSNNHHALRKDNNSTNPSTTAATIGRSSQHERERPTPSMKQNQFRPSNFLSYNNSRLHSIDLPLLTERDPFLADNASDAIRVECSNVNKVPLGSKGGPIPCIDVAIVSNGSALWKDQIVGTSCSAVSASNEAFAVGTTDGTIQIYSTSPTTGWSSRNAFRSHPPLILGTTVLSIQLIDQKHETESIPKSSIESVEMLVVTIDGGFGVWTIIPKLQRKYKGTLMPILTHMSYATDDRLFPKLARMQITDTGRLMAILSMDFSNTENVDGSISNSTSLNSSSPNVAGSGGSIQAFVYDNQSELWMRVSDSRFVLSDFYTALPSGKLTSVSGILSKIDDSVRIGSLQSTLKAAQRSRIVDRYVNGIYEQAEDEACNFVASRSHCEDRLACAVAMNSPSEFKHWLKNYIRILVIKGQSSALRLLVDILLQQKNGQSVTDSSLYHCWWLSYGTDILSENQLMLVKNLVIPEVSKSRKLQRLTNEISLEVDMMEQSATTK
jgi:protein HIRA/HIR1